nr:GHKL domain-containing protein [Bacteroidota bacterium]
SFTKQNDRYLFIAFINDITERKKAAAELSKKSDDLEIANKELEQFAYVASHDLQEPLRTISNFVGLLEKKYKDNIDDSANEYIRFIVKATAKMRNLINDLLDLARIGRDVVFKDVDCNEVMKEILSELEASIVESQAKIRFTPLPVIKGNQLEIKLLFQNLISNSLKFKKEKVNIDIQVTAEEKESEFLFAIKDNGIGIETQYKEKIFIIFQRLHTSEEYPGTGIGLATCKKIVVRHGGDIWVDSKVGLGSTFYFTIHKTGKQLEL